MLDTATIPTEAGVVAALAQRAVGGTIAQAPDGRTFLITPDDTTVQEVTDPHGLVKTPPSRIRQGVTLQTVDSLVDYVNRFKQDDTVLFADIAASSILALIDYHHPADDELPHEADFVEHRARLTLPFSVEWLTWTAIDGKLMSQLAFARFLEENSADIEAPSGADLLEACRDLQANRKVNFTKAVRTSSNNENFEYTDETSARSRNGGIEIPSEFLLRMPIYFGGPTYSIRAFLRWELLDGAGLTLGIQLHNREHIRQAVFKENVADAAGRTERTAFFGLAS